MKRDGTGLKNLGEGSYPDLSPDGKKIVYQKPNQGLWIAGSDGGFDSELDGDVTASSPVWNNDGRKIGYSKHDKVYIADTLGVIVDTTRPYLSIADWSPEDSNKVLCWDWKANKSVIVDLYQFNEDTLAFPAIKWSPEGNYFIGYDEEGYFIIKRNGADKWYLKP
jgi:Tol biopolymer transport system component